MDVFNALWDDPEQKKRPSNDGFQMFSAEEWISLSSTYKILSGTFSCPLSPDIEKAGPSSCGKESISTVNSSSVNTSRKQIQQKQNRQKNGFEVIKKQYIPGLVKLPSLTRMSALSSEEHRDCLSLLQKFDQRDLTKLSAAERAEYQLFVSLNKRVKEEQNEFIEFAKSHWEESVKRLSKLNGDALNFENQLWMAQVQHALSRYPKSFKKLKTISLGFKEKPPLQVCFFKNLLSIGRTPPVSLPQFEKPFRVSTRLNKLRAWGFLNIPQQQTAGTLHRVPVSGDPNAERLARMNGAHVVITSSGLKCLLDLHDDSNETNLPVSKKRWRLPVTVKDYRSFEKGIPTTKKIIFIDKALPLHAMTGPEKVLKYYKHALLAAVVHRHGESGKEFDIKGEEFCYTKLNGEKPFAPTQPLPEKEPLVPNTSSQSPVADQRESAESITPQNSNLSDSESDDSCDESKLIMDIDIEEFNKIPNFAEAEDDNVLLPSRNSSSLRSDEEFSSALANVDQQGLIRETSTVLESHDHISDPKRDSQTYTDKDKKLIIDDAYQVTPIKVIGGYALPLNVTNLVYNLWNLQENNTSSIPIKLLVRNHVQGCVSSGHGDFQDVCLACKPEFQLEFGAEAVSLSELSRQWVDLFFHPDASLVRVRVNAANSEMVKLERRSLLEVQNETCRLHGVDLGATLPVLHSVFSDLMSLECGEYMLCIDPENKRQAELLVKTQTDEPCCFNLSLEYKNSATSIPCDVPWQPLDTSVILPRHIFFNSMPCTFVAPNKIAAQPKQIVPRQSNQRGRNGLKSQSKKKKKKMKKKNYNGFTT